MENTKLRKLAGEVFGWTFDFGIVDLATKTVASVEEGDLEESIQRNLIYCDNCWKILRYYCTPLDPSWEEALDSWRRDIETLYNRYMKIAPWED